jgi:hypothetical protein
VALKYSLRPSFWVCESMMALKHMRRLAICQLKPKKSSKEEEEIIVVVAKGTSIYGQTSTPMCMVRAIFFVSIARHKRMSLFHRCYCCTLRL